jgi:hypothetical protein
MFENDRKCFKTRQKGLIMFDNLQKSIVCYIGELGIFFVIPAQKRAAKGGGIITETPDKPQKIGGI